MYEKQFLNDVATQNFTKYNIDVKAVSSKTSNSTERNAVDWLKNLNASPAKGKLFVINKRHVNDIIQTATAVVSDIWLKKPFLSTGMRAHLPIYDPLMKGKRPIMSIVREFVDLIVCVYSADGIIALTQTCAERGVFGVNLFLTDLAEDIIFYQNRYENSYAFLSDMNGIAIWHPSYPRPQAMKDDSLFPTDIQYLEKVELSVRKQWLTEMKGKVSVISEHQEVVSNR